MKTTGYKLRHAIREAQSLRDITASQWDDCLHVFPGEEKPSPDRVMRNFIAVEQRLARLQSAQDRYNLAVTVQVPGGTMTLCEAVKRVGGAGRAEKMWRATAGGTKKDKYAYGNDLVRNADQVRATPTVGVESALAMAKDMGRFAAALREAIEVGNATEVEIEGLDPSLFE